MSSNDFGKLESLQKEIEYQDYALFVNDTECRRERQCGTTFTGKPKIHRVCKIVVPSLVLLVVWFDCRL